MSIEAISREPYALANSTVENEGDFLRDSYIFGQSILDETGLSKPLRTYLFGSPISHSLAPPLHRTVFEDRKANWTYTLVESTDREDFKAKLTSDDFIGSAVTMPCKVSFLKECEFLTSEGRAIGAINTVFLRRDSSGRKLCIGTNTDCIGITQAFLQNFPDILSESRGRPALVIGAGGASRSAVYALWRYLGASEIYMVNRLDAEVQQVASSFPDCKITHISSIAQVEGLQAPRLIVGTVPDSPSVTPGEILAKEITDTILSLQLEGRSLSRPKGYIVEMCYWPSLETDFFKSAKEKGWEVLPGTEPLVYQAVAQDVLWLEKPLHEIPIQKAKEVMLEELKRHSQANV